MFLSNPPVLKNMLKAVKIDYYCMLIFKVVQYKCEDRASEHEIYLNGE